MADKPSPMGDARNDLLWFIAILVVLGIIWVVTGGPDRPAATEGAFIYAPYDPDSGNLEDRSGTSLGVNRSSDPNAYTKNSLTSPWADKVRLERGSASRSSLPKEEYVMVRNNSREQVTISGWSLKNGADTQTYRTSDGRLVAPRTKWVVIPNGAKIFYSKGANTLVPVALAPGEQAIITSGRMLGASFKTNMCTGYLGERGDYTFLPRLTRDCSDPESEPGFASLSSGCQDIISDFNRCETPEIKRNGTEINGYTSFTRSCRDFIVDHFSYEGCLKYHAGDADFNVSRAEWRVFLNQGELWRESNESISLYDTQGRLVDRLTY